MTLLLFAAKDMIGKPCEVGNNDTYCGFYNNLPPTSSTFPKRMGKLKLPQMTREGNLYSDRKLSFFGMGVCWKVLKAEDNAKKQSSKIISNCTAIITLYDSY